MPDLIHDRRPARELALIERRDWTTLARSYRNAADVTAIDPALTRRERARRWHEFAASAAVFEGMTK